MGHAFRHLLEQSPPSPTGDRPKDSLGRGRDHGVPSQRAGRQRSRPPRPSRVPTWSVRRSSRITASCPPSPADGARCTIQDAAASGVPCVLPSARPSIRQELFGQTVLSWSYHCPLHPSPLRRSRVSRAIAPSAHSTTPIGPSGPLVLPANQIILPLAPTLARPSATTRTTERSTWTIPSLFPSSVRSMLVRACLQPRT
ncbi:hypothetical protein OH76DRAFT_992991 [Lentinus brumalis]|uniref:Uncharacterized protein n=1 Tax=Lentinus brumalis TaxID=2498619 RepID=A0A371DQC3_9APHY|nr:hypothetical protein OH76DRAFT_992991 [Polyporus brumalis]